MENFINSVQTLFNLHTQIKFSVTTIDRVYQSKDIINSIKFEEHFFDSQSTLQSSINAMISNFCIITFCSFLDEYKNFNPKGCPENIKKRILYVRKQNEEGINRIKKWKDLKKFRNQLAAHNFKIDGKSFFSDEIKNLEYIIPNTISEKKLFLFIIERICINIANEFPEINLYMNPKSRMLDKIKLIGEEIDLEEEMKYIYEKMK